MAVARIAVPKSSGAYLAPTPPKPVINPGGVRKPAAPKAPPKPKVPAAPKVPALGAAAPVATPPPPPLDATYYSNTNANEFGVNNKITGLGQQSAASTQALQTALGNLAYQQPRQQLSLEQGANRRGALFSSVYDQQAGDLATQFANQRTQATNADTQRQQSVSQQLGALQAGIPIYNQQQALASALRQIAAVAKNPATGQPAAVPVAPKPADPKAGGHYVNVGGKWQLIHAVGPGQWAPGPVPGKGKK